MARRSCLDSLRLRVSTHVEILWCGTLAFRVGLAVRVRLPVREDRSVLLMFAEPFQFAFGVKFDSRLPLGPISGTSLAMSLLRTMLVSIYCKGSLQLTTNWNALISRIVSSTLRPTGKSLTVIWLAFE